MVFEAVKWIKVCQYDLVNKFEISIQKVLYRTHFRISTKGSVEKTEKNQNTSAILEVFKKNVQCLGHCRLQVNI